MDAVGQRWTDRTIRSFFLADGIWGWGSYGFEQGLIEVMGTQLLGHDDVEGWLTARQVTKMWRCRNAAKNR